jgi:hypothetical protein
MAPPELPSLDIASETAETANFLASYKDIFG